MADKYVNTCVDCGKEFITQRPSLNGRCRPCAANDMWLRRPTRPKADCAKCGKMFKKDRDGSRFCSQDCYDAARASRIYKTCPICGKRFSTYGSYVNRYKQCSKECSVKRGRDGKCRRCGKTFRYSGANGRQRHYCSEACRRPPLLFNCQTCNKTFRRTPDKAVRGRARFCSFRCYRRFVGESSIERIVRKTLESKQVGFIPEFAITNRMVFDFYVPSFNLLIECDGNYWHSTPRVKTRDKIKTAKAQELGYRVERLTESFINSAGLSRHLDTLLTQLSLL